MSSRVTVDTEELIVSDRRELPLANQREDTRADSGDARR